MLATCPGLHSIAGRPGFEPLVVRASNDEMTDDADILYTIHVGLYRCVCVCVFHSLLWAGPVLFRLQATRLSTVVVL